MDSSMYLDPAVIAITGAALALVAFLITTIVIFRQHALLKRYRLLLSGDSGRDLEQILLQQAAAIETLQGEVRNLHVASSRMAEDARLHIQRTATIRFNAFPDTGSDLSFAIALLDAKNNGFVLSSLYGRSESRVYAKPIVNGSSTYQLSEEEKQALTKAMGSSPNT